MQQNENFAKQAEQAEAERPEVVARVDGTDEDWFIQPEDETELHNEGLLFAGCELGRMIDFDRIVGALRAENAKLSEALDECDGDRWKLRSERDAANARLHEVATACATAEQERDAALARVAELERQEPVDVPGPDEIHQMAFEEGQPAEDGDGYLFSAEEFDLFVQRLLDSCAPPVARAQHSVPEEFSFEYRHPNGESHTVTVSRDQVINEMPDFLFEALCSKFCNCEPAGETNVVECCCDEYAEEFKLLAAEPGTEVPEGYALIPVRETEAMHDAVMALLYKGVARIDTQKLLDAYIAAAPAQAQHSVPGDIMRDAQRYRWLRDQQFYFSFSTENSDAGISSCTAGMSSRFKNLSWVDAAIDSAIAAAPGKEVGHE
ncbi:TPA: hypothetical protein ACRMWT_000429 [Pseudomonas aeruginosa]